MMGWGMHPKSLRSLDEVAHLGTLEWLPKTPYLVLVWLAYTRYCGERGGGFCFVWTQILISGSLWLELGSD